ncbi:MAG: response regulator transcription factor [Acidobacteria bacterium]|nr:response regulator transcription factor [Acidobacteriota bacterium]
MPDAARRIRIAIADDHQIFRDGLRRLLESEPAFEVVAEAADGIEAIAVTRDTRPDVLLLDLAMPRMDGLEALGAEDVASTHVILLTAAIDAGELRRAVQLGARGMVLKQSATRHLIEGIHAVMDGKLLIGEEIADDLARAARPAAPARPYGLTPRELEIVEAIAAGDGNRDIATRFNISPQTVKHHLTSIFDKTGTSTRLELALFAIRQGIVDAP